MIESFEVEVLSLGFVGVEARNQSSCDNPERRNLVAPFVDGDSSDECQCLLD
jgi:hypothetical protein